MPTGRSISTMAELARFPVCSPVIVAMIIMVVGYSIPDVPGMARPPDDEEHM
jgi:hypothetical protein